MFPVNAKRLLEFVVFILIIYLNNFCLFINLIYSDLLNNTSVMRAPFKLLL